MLHLLDLDRDVASRDPHAKIGVKNKFLFLAEILKHSKIDIAEAFPELQARLSLASVEQADQVPAAEIHRDLEPRRVRLFPTYILPQTVSDNPDSSEKAQMQALKAREKDPCRWRCADPAEMLPQSTLFLTTFVPHMQDFLRRKGHQQTTP